MGSTPISTAFLLISLTLVIFLEWAAAAINSQIDLSRLCLIGITRTAQILAVTFLMAYQYGGLQRIGLDRKNLLPGLKKGLFWSAGFALVAVVFFFVLYMAGTNPLMLIRSPVPEGISQRILFFFVGGVVAPVAEEIVFRGVIFSYLRRLGLASAILLSTGFFAMMHMGSAIPFTQIVGGVVFAFAYHTGKSLLVPILIHSLGNLAIFTLSLL